MSMQDSTKDAFEVARFGIETERFLSSQIGRYLIGRAESERDKAINAFKEVDPANVSEVRKLQDAVNIPDRIMRWLSEAIENGRVAHDMIRVEEANADE
jgi:hypothetical protein